MKTKKWTVQETEENQKVLYEDNKITACSPLGGIFDEIYPFSLRTDSRTERPLSEDERLQVVSRMVEHYVNRRGGVKVAVRKQDPLRPEIVDLINGWRNKGGDVRLLEEKGRWPKPKK